MPLNPLAEGDIACVAFSETAAFEPFIAAARAVAADFTPNGAARSAVHAAAAQVRELGLSELIGELHIRGEGVPLLFHLAGTLGHADVEAAWAGLHGASAELLGEGLGDIAVALPRAGTWGNGWAVWLPLATADAEFQVVWPDASQRRLLGPTPLAAFGHRWPHRDSAPLLGMPDARLCLIAPDALSAAPHGAVRKLAPGAWAAYVNAQSALLLGLIDGACRRLVQEAFAYAKQRQSAGKPIAHYQAVALRLADLALNQQALALYATAAVEQGAAIGMAGPSHCNAAHVDELAFRIARDSVQIAAAHGYVEGLPFKRLFEQLRTLSSVLSCVLGTPLGTASITASSTSASTAPSIEAGASEALA